MGAIHFKDWNSAYIPEILQEIYIKRVYKPFLNGKKDLTIVDCGANIGLTAMYFSQFAKVVYALEPAKQHIEVLSRNMLDNNIKNVTIVPKALSNVNGTTKFYHSPNSTMFSLNDAATNKDDYEEVETITMDKFLDEYKIDHVDFMKIDTEGMELEILSSDGFKKVAHKIDTIVGEWHQWSKGNVNLMISALRDSGYSFQWLQGTDASIFLAKRT